MLKLPIANISSESSFHHVDDLLTRIVAVFGLQSLHPQISDTYRAILEESLAFPLGTKPRGYSRINHDGTPIQFAVTLGNTSHRYFQFIGEAGKPGIIGIDRLRVNHNCFTLIAQSLQLDSSLGEIAGLINIMASETNVDLINDPGGAFWIGAGFAFSNAPQLKIYMNGTWGRLNDRWKRIGNFAAHFGAFNYWENLITPYTSKLLPLGTAITLKRGSPIIEANIGT